MTSWAKPGEKCVCVKQASIGPRMREVCTIDEVHHFNSTLFLAIRGYGWQQTGATERRRILFAVTRFRPLVSQEQDIALFRQLLDGAPAETAEAPELVDVYTGGRITTLSVAPHSLDHEARR